MAMAWSGVHVRLVLSRLAPQRNGLAAAQRPHVALEVTAAVRRFEKLGALQSA